MVYIRQKTRKKAGAKQMDFLNFQIGKKQIHDFATVIYADVFEYINNHQEEYEKFLKDELNKGDEKK